MQLRNRRVAAGNGPARIEGDDAVREDEGREPVVQAEAPPQFDAGEVVMPPAVNPMYQQFLQFQQFQAFMQANPMPQIPMGPRMEVPNVRRGIEVEHVDPGMMVAMSQVKPPMLEGLKISEIKAFYIAYRRYSSRCVVPQWKRKPGQLVLPEHLLTIATVNGLGDVDFLRDMEDEEFFTALCRIHNCTMATSWSLLVDQVKMKATVWSLEAFMEYVDDFRMQLRLAGDECAPPQKEIVKIFVNGLSPKSLQTEIRKRQFETLGVAAEQGVEIVLRFKPIFDLQSSYEGLKIKEK